MKYIIFLCVFFMNFLSFATTIAAEEEHSLLLDTEGKAWATGNNEYGQLGLGDDISIVEIATKIEGLPRIIAVAAGYSHSLFLDEEGNVWATGSNKDGQLGLGDNVNTVQVPTKINNLPPIKAVAAGYNHSLFLDEEGNVLATGSNTWGQLGLGDNVNTVQVPTKINNLPPIKAVATRGFHSLFLDKEGNVWATDSNKEGQLALGDNVNREVPTKINNLPAIKAIAAGVEYSLFLDMESSVWATGDNISGQLGLGDDENRNIPTKIDTLPTIKAVAAGDNHSLFLDEKGNVWATGINDWGQLGLGDNENRNIPTKIDTLPTIKAVAAGTHSLFLDEEGNVWATGSNAWCQLGLGDDENRNIPTKIDTLPTIEKPLSERGKIPTKSARKIVE